MKERSKNRCLTPLKTAFERTTYKGYAEDSHKTYIATRRTFLCSEQANGSTNPSDLDFRDRTPRKGFVVAMMGQLSLQRAVAEHSRQDLEERRSSRVISGPSLLSNGRCDVHPSRLSKSREHTRRHDPERRSGSVR